jgi:O-antigen/teichoic acid export membrane protein
METLLSNIDTDILLMTSMLREPVFRSSFGLAIGFLGAGLSVFLSRIFLTNEVEGEALKDIFALGSLIALIVVISVEGFSSLLSASKENLLPHLRNINLISVGFTVAVSFMVIPLSGLISQDYRFIIENLWVAIISVVVCCTIAIGQTLEAVAAVKGKNLIPLWRRASTQLIALGIFATLWGVGSGWSNITILLVWFLCAVTAGIISSTTSQLWLFRSEPKAPRTQMGETMKSIMPNYLEHHFSKLGIVLPRFIVPVLIVILLGAETGIDFVLLWTVLGLISLVISSISRGYLSHAQSPRSYSVMMKSWLIMILAPTAILFLSSDWVMSVFGEQYSELGHLLRIGLVSTIPYALLDFMLARMKVQGQIGLSSIISMSSGAILLLTVVIASLQFGLEGAMYSFMLVYTLFGASASILYRLKKTS